jgi:AMMECR1 domain-containing protein
MQQFSVGQCGTGKMAAANSRPKVPDPADNVVINRDHVKYAFAVLREQYTGEPAKLCFEDVSCLPTKPFQVYVIWTTPRAKITGNGGDTDTEVFISPDRRCRGSNWAQSTLGLADAIKKAAEKHDPRYQKILKEDLPELTCTVHLLQKVQELGSTNWKPQEHGLMLIAPPNSSSLLDQKATGKHTKVVYLKEVPHALNWSLFETLDHLLKRLGYHGVGNPVTFCKKRRGFSVRCFETSLEVLSMKDCGLVLKGGRMLNRGMCPLMMLGKTLRKSMSTSIRLTQTLSMMLSKFRRPAALKT